MGKVPRSIGIRVPSVKLDLISSEPLQEQASTSAPPPTEETGGGLDMENNDFLCPICMQIINDAFLTSCGHSFCHMCIMQHLQTKNDCPCCFHYLTSNHLYPNFLLNKLLKKSSIRGQVPNPASPFEKLHLALQQGCNVSVKELDSLLSVLLDKKKKMEEEDAESNMQTLLYFLHCLWKKKIEELNQIQHDLQYIEEDINVVEGRKIDPYMDVSQSGLAIAMKNTVQNKLGDLQECYLQNRREERDPEVKRREGYHSGLEDFYAVFTTFTRYSRLEVIAEHKHCDMFHAANIVSSIDFDRDDELFATAGVSRRIKIFGFSSVVNEPTSNQYPVLEMPTRSKLSCLSWNKYTNNLIASSDYEGIVTVWDIATGQSVIEYEEHEKRAWSVDFSRTEPAMMVSGSDDGKVKVWSTKQEVSIINIDMKANVCSVKYNPGSSMHIAVGSADHHIYYYDLRNSRHPIQIFSGHKKAVSYVRFMSNNEIASASTDSTLRLWDVNDDKPVSSQLCPFHSVSNVNKIPIILFFLQLRTFRGHTNDRNFVGLSANGEYIACGSETNEVYVYHKGIPSPAAWHSFECSEDTEKEDAGPYFISAMCWKSDSPTMLCANSRGTIKVLGLAP
ncbi:E3 ubiquitin-protein ligase COP1-like isoform X2 [Impatiens glandulifera]|uniref:E3 ubiquitin-protein ligase COP1-like isoform X2 n=1 Tax=Impatiens glandulifera TaxID=253017 RepID=UPI001FB092E8|nr:E3 ubiquitin-protein ligase COP1-like isoform X2 [Impatiens glandulifera]